MQAGWILVLGYTPVGPYDLVNSDYDRPRPWPSVVAPRCVLLKRHTIIVGTLYNDKSEESTFGLTRMFGDATEDYRLTPTLRLLGGRQYVFQ